MKHLLTKVIAAVMFAAMTLRSSAVGQDTRF